VADSSQARILAADDRAAISQLLATYCHGIDHHDWLLVQSCFAPDATLRYGQYEGDAAGFVRYAQEGLASMIRHSHQLGQTYFQRLDSGIRSETYATCFHRYQTGESAEDLVVGARYVDDLAQDPSGAWKIARRTMVYDWTRIDPVRGELNDPSLIRGSVDESDPWYATGAERSKQPQ
jgi:hypothetical protein